MKRLIYFGPSGIGDWCVILPTLDALLERAGCNSVIAVIPRRNPGNAILLRDPRIEQIIYLDRPDRTWMLTLYLWKLFITTIRLRRFKPHAAAISYLSHQPDTLLLCLASGADKRLGWPWKKNWLEKNAINTPVNASQSDDKFTIHRRIAGMNSIGRHHIYLLDTQPISVALPSRDFVVLGVGGGRNASWRFWPARHFQSLIQNMPELHFVLLGGGEDDARVADEVMKTPQPNVTNLVDRISFDESLRVMRESLAVVGNDSGLTNISALHDIPTLTLYGPTDPCLTGAALLGAEHVSIQVPCGPCFANDQDPGTALNCHHHRCLADLSPDIVASRLMNILGKHT